MAQAQLWLKTLRQAVKGDYWPGWILKEQYDRFKIGRAERDVGHRGAQPACTSPPIPALSEWPFRRL